MSLQKGQAVGLGYVDQRDRRRHIVFCRHHIGGAFIGRTRRSGRRGPLPHATTFLYNDCEPQDAAGSRPICSVSSLCDNFAGHNFETAQDDAQAEFEFDVVITDCQMVGGFNGMLEPCCT
jgi:hypothetical protein